MTAIAILFLVLSVLIIWGGLVASTVFLAQKGEVSAYPAGAPEDDTVDE